MIDMILIRRKWATSGYRHRFGPQPGYGKYQNQAEEEAQSAIQEAKGHSIIAILLFIYLFFYCVCAVDRVNQAWSNLDQAEWCFLRLLCMLSFLFLLFTSININKLLTLPALCLQIWEGLSAFSNFSL